MSSLSRLAFVFAVISSLAHASPAEACSSVPPCVSVWETVPSNGAEEVPLNVELEAVPPRYATPYATVAVSLRVAGTDVELPLVAGTTRGRWRAELALAPRTEYELLGPRELALGSATWCASSPVVLATFTTGDAADDTAPTDPTASGGGCAVAECGDGGCCGPYLARISGAHWSATDDGALPIAYAFGSPDGPRTFALAGAATDWPYTGSGQPLATLTPIPGSGPVFAIDAAGNVSAHGATFELDFSCPLVSADGGIGVADGGPDAGGSGGCSATHGASGATGFASMIAVALSLVLRRRHAS